MALDSRLKRSAAVNVRQPWRGILPAPDGTVAAADRQVIDFMAASPAASAPAVPTAHVFPTPMRRRHRR